MKRVKTRQSDCVVTDELVQERNGVRVCVCVRACVGYRRRGTSGGVGTGTWPFAGGPHTPPPPIHSLKPTPLHIQQQKSEHESGKQETQTHRMTGTGAQESRIAGKLCNTDKTRAQG